MIGRPVAGRLMVAGALLTAALAGCAESGADTASSRPMPPAAADPPQPYSTPDPAATGARTPEGGGAAGTGTAGTDPAGSPGDGAGGAEGADGTGMTGSGGTAGSGGDGSNPSSSGEAGRSGAEDGASGAGGADRDAAGGSAGPLVPDLPSVAPSPVFLGEACDPDRDSEPAMAVNGLVLHCVQVPEPEITGAAPSGVGRWSPGPPSQGNPTGPEPGGECDPADVGKVVPGAGGRPLSCLREPDGAMRWADVS